MSVAQQLARAHRERLARLNALPSRPVLLRDVGQPLPVPFLKPNRHDYWPNKTVSLPPYLVPSAPSAPAPDVPRFPRIRQIQLAVCKHYGIELIDMISERRTQHVVRPRQVAMYLCRKLTPRGLPEIGRSFGNRDHTTVLHGARKIEWRLETDDELVADVASLTAKFDGYC